MAKTDAANQIAFETTFGTFPDSASPLFEGRAGIPINEALPSMTNSLSAVACLAIDAGYEADDDSGWAIVRLLEMSRALLDASMAGAINLKIAKEA